MWGGQQAWPPSVTVIHDWMIFWGIWGLPHVPKRTPGQFLPVDGTFDESLGNLNREDEDQLMNHHIFKPYTYTLW